MIFLNQKMNLTKEDLKKIKDNVKSEKLIFFPTMPLLSYATEIFEQVGSQDVSVFEEGPYTGQTSIKTLKSLNIKYCLIGHSEKRKYLNETEEKIIKKIELCQKYNITPIVIVGETKEDYLQKITLSVIEKQLTSIFNNIRCNINNVIIAYEPLWSIGSIAADTNYINEVMITIKKIMKDYYDSELKVIYGGGINGENIKMLKTISSLDGFLVGSSSMDYNEINKICDETN